MRCAPRATALLAGLLSLAAGRRALRAPRTNDGTSRRRRPRRSAGRSPARTGSRWRRRTSSCTSTRRSARSPSAPRASPNARYRLITRYLNWRPSGRISIALFDHTDTANGGATSVPYNHIYAYGAPPDGMDELSDFDDFVKLLVTHEFTHVVHLDTILSWCPRLVNTIFGKIYAPNLSQPNWFIEGLAVLMESRQTTAGRLRSSFQHMHLRVPFLEGRAARLRSGQRRRRAARLSARQRPLPVRRAASCATSRTASAPTRSARSRTATPTSASPAASTASPRRRSGARYTDRVRQRRLGRLEAVDVAPLRAGDRRSRRGAALTGRAASDLRPAVAARHAAPAALLPRRHAGLQPRQQRPGARVRPARSSRRASSDVLADAYGGGPAAPTPDGRGLVFQRAQLHPAAAAHRRQRVRRLDRPLSPRSGRRRRAAADPRLSRPRARRVARRTAGRVRRDAGRAPCASWRVVSIDGGAPRVLAPDVPGIVYTPAFSPDGRLIAYSRVKPGGFRDIHVYDLTPGSDRALMFDRAMDVDPRFSPDGRFVLFASDRTGIYDVYAHELATARLYQVTNLVDGGVPAGGLARRQAAGLHRLHLGRLRSLRHVVRSGELAAGAAVRQHEARRSA